MNINKLLLLLGLTPALLFGQVKYIEKGIPAPYSGYLFTEDAELTNRKTLIEHKFMLQELDLYKQNEDILIKQADLWKNQSRDLADQLNKKERMTFWENTLYFALGALVTTGLAFGVSRATR